MENLEIKIPRELSTTETSNKSVKQIHDEWRVSLKKQFEEMQSKKD